MFDSQCIGLRTVDVSRRPASLAAIQALLAANQLVMDSGVTLLSPPGQGMRWLVAQV